MVLRLENITKTYSRAGREVKALDNVSLDLERGQFMGIIGDSGAGKTTLLKIAAGLIAPDKGRVLFEGRPVDQLTQGELFHLRRHQVGSIWGTGTLVPRLSVLENVAAPALLLDRDLRTAVRKASEALDLCGAGHAAKARPDELSDGERQRVAIAQAVVTQPMLLLGDEPARGLGVYEQDSVLYLLQSLAHDTRVAVLIVDASATGVMRTQPLLFLREGELMDREPLGEMGKLIDLKKGAETGDREPNHG